MGVVVCCMNGCCWVPSALYIASELVVASTPPAGRPDCSQAEETEASGVSEAVTKRVIHPDCCC